jgi:hypothetical protein
MNMLIASDYARVKEDLGIIITGIRETYVITDKPKSHLHPSTDFYFWRYCLNESKEPSLIFDTSQPSNDKINLWDLVFPKTENDVIKSSEFISLGGETLHYLTKASEKYSISLPIRPEINSKYPPKIVCRVSEKVLDFYVTQDNQIVHTSSKDKTIVNVIDKGEIGTVADLVFHTQHNSLLIQDSEKKEIGLHLLDEPKERYWRSFTLTGAVPVSGKSFSNETFTLSCLLRLVDKGSETYPRTESSIRFWMEKDKVHFQCYSEGKLIDLSFDKKDFFPKENNSDWFQFTVQKDKNEFRFYVDGILAFSHNAPDFIDLHSEETIFLSCPGYFMAELRIWNIIRTPKQLKTYSRTWLPVSQYNGLSGYWHLFVKDPSGKYTGLAYEHVNKSGQIEMIQEPDLSGNGNHLVVQKGNKPVEGELNYQTMHPVKAPSPFPKVIPLYDLKIIKQGLQIDDNTGKVYWIDESENGRTYMMCGSTLGHIPPTQLFEINSDGDFALLSQVNSPYENLILAHAERRKAMEEKFDSITSAHKKGHEDVLTKHKELLETLNNSLSEKKQKKTKESKDHYNTVHQEWLQALDHMNKEQENLISASKKSRETALEKAKAMTDKAQKIVIENRKVTYDKKPQNL